MAATAPVQVAAGSFNLEQFHNSGIVRRTIQGTKVVHEFVITGNPIEAFHSQGLGGFQIGDIHPFLNDLYLEDQEFVHLIKNADQSVRKTLARFTYSTRPCLGYYQETSDSITVPQPTWWVPSPDGDNEVLLIGGYGTPVMIPEPLTAHVRRFPNVAMTWARTIEIQDQIGTLNPLPFLAEAPEVWLLQKATINLLYGVPQGGKECHWEVVLQFLADRKRQHRIWVPRTVAHGEVRELVKPVNVADIPNAHHRISIRYLSTYNFDKLVPLDPKMCYRQLPSSGD